MSRNRGAEQPPSLKWNALRLLADGKTPAEVSKKLSVPWTTVDRWSKTHSEKITKIANNKLRNREAFHAVVARYNDIRSILGNPGAMDYSHITGGSGAKYAPDKGLGFQMIDFTVDVDNTAAAILSPEDFTFWKEHIQDQDYDLTKQSEEFLSFQEHLGSEFIARGIYPVAEYFGELKN